MIKSILAITVAGIVIASAPSAAWARGGHGHYAGHGHHRFYAPARIRYAPDPYGYGYRPPYAYRAYSGGPVFVSIGGHEHHDYFHANHGYGGGHGSYGHGGLGYGHAVEGHGSYGDHMLGGHGYGGHGYGGGHGGEHE